MGREPRRRRAERRPPPLPPETRTIGQLVAETIRFYGQHFWISLSLGVGPAAIGIVATFFTGVAAGAFLAGVGAVVFPASYVAACLVVTGRRPGGRAVANALLLAVLVYLPVPFLTIAFVLPAAAWLALVGMAVPAMIVEDLSPRAALSRGSQLGRADFVHAAGSLVALGIVFVLMGAVMSVLIRSGSGQTTAIAAFLANLVLSPILFLGGALLYGDQAARHHLKSPSRNERILDADVPHADHADRSGSSDTPIAS